MRVLPAVILVAVAAPAEARPWIDLVGDYTATLAWTGCTAPGTRVSKVSLDAIDGALAIDLAPAGGGLRSLPLVESDRGTLDAQQGDVTLALTPTGAGALALSLELTSGCRATGTLVRATTKLPSCDRMVAAARIAAACTKLPSPIAPLVATKYRRKDVRMCSARTVELETAVTDAGCLPIDDPAASMLGAQCRQLVAEAQKLKRCPSVPPQFVAAADRLITIAQPAAAGASRGIVEQACREGHDLVVELAARSRCPL